MRVAQLADGVNGQAPEHRPRQGWNYVRGGRELPGHRAGGKDSGSAASGSTRTSRAEMLSYARNAALSPIWMAQRAATPELGQEIINTWVLGMDLTPLEFMILAQVVIFLTDGACGPE